METMGMVLVLAYCAWGVYSGYKFMSGRSEWLDQKSPLNAFAKIMVSAIVGGFIGAFNLFRLIFGLFGRG